MLSKRSAPYEADLAAWAEAQAQALRAQRFHELDLEHLAEEIEDLAKSDRRALESDLIVIMAHLLKWFAQPEQRSLSWRNTIREHRRRIRAILRESPSLRRELEELAERGYSDAREKASDETELPADKFSPKRPFSLDEILTGPVDL